MAAVDILKVGEHPHIIPDPLPSGNYVAKQLRAAYDDSSNLLPASAGSQRSYNKYVSVTTQDFYIKDFKENDPDYDDTDAAKLPFQRKRETVADVLLKPHENQMFHSWSVPPRYVSEEEFGIPDTTPEEVKKVVTPPLPERISRQMSLPNINLRSGKAPAQGLKREYTKMPTTLRSPVQSKAVPVLQRSRTDLKPTAPKTELQRAASAVQELEQRQYKTEAKNNMEDIRKEFQKSFQPHAVRNAEHYFKLAPNADRKVIERILRMTEKKHQLDNTLRKSLLPDAKDTVDKWLDGATEEERQVALRFFGSLAGSKLMGVSVADQKKRLQQVIKTLEEADGRAEPQPEIRPRMVPKGKGKFNHIRLLSPATRNNRWMHTTWHHLPQYKEPVVENWSSHYIRPHAAVPRHFVIHPDWG